MLNAKDLELLAAKGIGEKQIEEQLACFVKGFPFLELTWMPGMLIWQRIRRS